MSQELQLNGINADGSSYSDELGTPITTEMIAKVARGQKLGPEDVRDLKQRKALDQQKTDHFGVQEGADPTKLDESGWGVVFPNNLPPKSVEALKEALKPLLDHRKKQAAAQQEIYYREFIGEEHGYKQGETKNDFLKRFGKGPGPADPEKVPYYLMLVGSPETIPFMVQYQLDVQYAVGRIYFEKLEDYYQYATSVVAAETKGISRGKRAAYFGVANPDDRATQMSAESLIKPLSQNMKTKYKDWSLNLVDPASSTKSNLANYMGGKDTPALLFTASHGMNFKLNDPRLMRHTGAILCQDWPGPKARVPITEDFYFSADDLAADADVFGMMAFIFACYGGGIPKMDNFYRQAFGEQKAIAPHAFLSQLPMKLLSHPKGGALAVFAHIERAWGSSIMWDGSVRDVETFDSTIDALLNGKPAGNATEYFNERYAEISSDLTAEMDSTTPDNQDDVKLAGMWTSNNDARNYALLGDPAARMVHKDKETPASERASLGALVSKIPASVSGAATAFQPDIVDRTVQVSGSASGPQENFGVFGIGEKKTEPANVAIPETGQPVSRANNPLKEFAEKVGQYLSKALDDATSLEVSTYVTDDMSNASFVNGTMTGADLRAFTHINIDGDTVICLPKKDGDVDSEVWEIHLQMVKQAQESRAELMKTIVSAVSSIAGLPSK
jgi:hypothetical protein